MNEFVISQGSCEQAIQGMNLAFNSLCVDVCNKISAQLSSCNHRYQEVKSTDQPVFNTIVLPPVNVQHDTTYQQFLAMIAVKDEKYINLPEIDNLLKTLHMHYQLMQLYVNIGGNKVTDLEIKSAMLRRLFQLLHPHLSTEQRRIKFRELFHGNDFDHVAKMLSKINGKANQWLNRGLSKSKPDRGESFDMLVALWSPDTEFDGASLIDKLQILDSKIKQAHEQLRSLYSQQKQCVDTQPIIIFLCSEWTFSNYDNANGNYTYTKADVALIKNHFLKLSQKYPRSLLIPGSIRVLKELQRSMTPKYLRRFSQHVDFNARIYRDDPQQHSKYRPNQSAGQLARNFLVGKQHCKNQALIFHRGECLSYDKQVDGKDVVAEMKDDFEFYPGGKSGVFNAMGLNFGLEICMDHTAERLLAESKGYSIDCHLIISCVVTTKEDGVALSYDQSGKPYGAVINCAGLFSVSPEHADYTGIGIVQGQANFVYLNRDETHSEGDIWVYHYNHQTAQPHYDSPDTKRIHAVSKI